LGVEIVAISVDPPERALAMRGRWNLPIAIHSDPGGERFLEPLGLWNPEEREGLAIPALLVISSDGEEHFRVTSRDFADRIHDEDALGALEALGWSGISPEPPPAVEAPDPELKGVFTPRLFNPYFRGNFYAAVAIGRRVKDEDARRESKAHRLMAQSFLETWKEWRTRNEA